MAKPDSLGQFEQLVMTAILARREDAYGVTIHSKVEELARPKAVSLGAVYVTLDRLEDKGLIASWLSDPTARARRPRQTLLSPRSARRTCAGGIGRHRQTHLGKPRRRLGQVEWGRRWGKELR